MKRILIILLLSFFFCFPVRAEGVYEEHYKQSGAEDLDESLTEEAREFFIKENIDLKEPDWVNQITAGNIFSEIFSFIGEGFKQPFKSGLAMFGVIVIFSAVSGMESMKQYQKLTSYIFAPLCVLIIFMPLFSLIDSAMSAAKAGSTFMLSFVPVYAGILTVGGQGLTASGMSLLLLGAAEAVSMLCSFVIVPLMGCYLSIGLISSISQNGSSVALGELIKKAAMWILSITLTVFLGLLSIQTAVNSSADGLGIKTAKFVLGSFLPVAGSAISESLTTVTAAVKLLKSSVGMYGVVAVCAMVLPVVLEMLLWRLVIFLLIAAEGLFGAKLGTDIFKSIDCVLSVLIGVMLFCAGLFIISLAIVSGVK